MCQNNSKYHFFFGHTGPIERACFSQWFMRDFEVDGQVYCCAEQYMMAEKARLFGDEGCREAILDTNFPKDIKELGRQVKNFDQAVWDEHKQDIVRKGNIAKFSQNPDLKEILLATGDKILVEASPFDKIWGIGHHYKAKAAQDESTWRGQNLLGYILTDVKKMLAEDLQNGGASNEA